MRRVVRNEPFADLCSNAPAHRYAIIVQYLVGRIVDMRNPYRRQCATAHQEMPPAGVILMIVNRVVFSFTKNLAKFSGKLWQMGATVTQVIDLRSQLPCFLVKDSG